MPSGDLTLLYQRVSVLYLAGYSQPVVAARVGRSRERVRQILKEQGIELRSRQEQSALDSSEKQEQLERAFAEAVSGREDEIEDLFWQTRSFDAVGARLALDPDYVKRVLQARWPDIEIFVSSFSYVHQQFSDDDLLAALRRAAASKVESGPLTVDEYDLWEEQGNETDPRPSRVLILARLESWRKALLRAGLPANAAIRGDGEFTTEACTKALAQAWLALGRPPSMAEYKEWAAEKNVSLGSNRYPGTERIRTRFRMRWREAQVSAYPLVHDRTPPLSARREDDGASQAETDPAFAIGKPYRPRETFGSRILREMVALNPELLERGIRSHFRMEADLADAAIQAGFRPLSPPQEILHSTWPGETDSRSPS